MTSYGRTCAPFRLRNDIDVADQAAPPEAWELFDGPANQVRHCPHFSIEMETGTGKTYVYLRTIFELSRRYGFQKFIIVVPSVAIREGVLKNIEITGEHFRALYNNLPFEHFVYDAKKVNRLRQFATSNTLQILVINIDAFRKNFTGTEEEQQEQRHLQGERQAVGPPADRVRAGGAADRHHRRAAERGRHREGPGGDQGAQPAVHAALLGHPSEPVQPRLPARPGARLRAAAGEADRRRRARRRRAPPTTPSCASEQIRYVHEGIKAKLRIHVQTPDGPKEKAVTVKQGSDLFALSNERACYREGFEVAEINAEPGSEYVRFANGRTLRQGEEIGGLRDDVWRAQIKHTVKRHLEKELQVRARGLKVLSLFFVDRVANYRDYGG